MKIVNKTNNSIIAQKTKVADTFLSRMIGLLNRAALLPDEALIITCCKSVHMFFMRFAIDVIFVNKKNCVVGLAEGLKPFCLSPIYFGSSYAIETAAGVIAKTKTSIGDQIELVQAEA